MGVLIQLVPGYRCLVKLWLIISDNIITIPIGESIYLYGVISSNILYY